jgi:hypothetical protein
MQSKNGLYFLCSRAACLLQTQVIDDIETALCSDTQPVGSLVAALCVRHKSQTT